MSRPQQSVSPEFGGVSTVSVTCVADGRSHAVPDAELVVGSTRHSGHFAAICGHLITPAPMVAPDGELCRTCAERDVRHRRRRVGRFFR